MNTVSQLPFDAGTGSFHGHRTRRLDAECLWVEVLADGGPRLVRLGLAGSPENLLAETPDLGWPTPLGRYELLGGHRLWFAPEDPDRVAVPDTHGLELELGPGGVRLTGHEEPSTGLVRSIEVCLDPAAPILRLRHEVRNCGARPIELSAWPITQLPLGGVVLLPDRPASAGHATRPNRTLVLWPYASWDDPRFEPHDGLLLIHAAAGDGFKLGYFNEVGWVGYLREGVLLVRRFKPAVGKPHPDRGCNAEAYCGDRYLELELLAPLTVLAPGELAIEVERWEVFRLETDGGTGTGAQAVEAAVRVASAQPAFDSTIWTEPEQRLPAWRAPDPRSYRRPKSRPDLAGRLGRAGVGTGARAARSASISGRYRRPIGVRANHSRKTGSWRASSSSDQPS